MDKITCLVGASGSGKTTLATGLEKLGYNIIHSYTTREPREEGEWGHTFLKGWEQNFNFITSPNSGKSFNYREMIAFKELYGEMYFATKEQYKGKGTSIYVVDPQGAEMVKENVKDAEVITIFLFSEEVLRLRRMRADRDIEQCHNRIYEDREIFKICKCDYVVDANRAVKEVLSDVVEIVGE